MNLATRKPESLEEALDIVRGHVDAAYRAARRSNQNLASGLQRPKTKTQVAQEMHALNMLLKVLQDLDPRFGVTEFRLREEALDRIKA